jgi:hypothetical protein
MSTARLARGRTTDRRWPKAVAGGLVFNQVPTGWFHTCGVTPANRAYCWGYGGAVGDGTSFQRLKPVAVAGGLG